jgi:hypothetical protein
MPRSQKKRKSSFIGRNSRVLLLSSHDHVIDPFDVRPVDRLSVEIVVRISRADAVDNKHVTVSNASVRIVPMR